MEHISCQVCAFEKWRNINKKFHNLLLSMVMEFAFNRHK